MRFLRALTISVGLAVLGLFGVVELILRRRSPAGSEALEDAGDAGPLVGPEGPPLSRALSGVRLVAGGVGVALAGYGVYLVVRTVPWTSYLAIAIWLAAAIILHDAILVPAVSVVRGITVRAGRRLPNAALAVVEGAFVVGGVISLVALPEIWAKRLGPLNPTVLPGSYGQALLVTWLVLAVVTVGSVVVLTRSARRARRSLGSAEMAAS